MTESETPNEQPDDLEAPDMDALVGDFPDDDEASEADAAHEFGDVIEDESTAAASNDEQEADDVSDSTLDSAVTQPQQRPEEEAAAPTPAGLSPAPAFQEVPRFRPTALVVSGLLIALGMIFVWPLFSGGYTLAPGGTLAIATVGIALGLLAHWSNTRRRARGALFLALIILFWGLLTGVFVLEAEQGLVATGWPLYLATLGGTLLLTFLGDRRRDRQFLVPGTALIIAGLAGLLVTQQQIPTGIVDFIEQIGAWWLVVLAVALLPLAFRQVPRRN